MAHIRIVIRRIAIKEAFGTVATADDIQRIGTLQLHILQTNGQIEVKGITLVRHLFGRGVFAHIVAPTTIELPGKSLRT